MSIQSVDMSRIIGIDPGSRKTGFAVVECDRQSVRCLEFGVLKLNLKSDFSGRLFELDLALANIFKKYRPQYCSLEKIFLGKNVDSAFKLGHARGICIAKTLEVGAKLYEYSPRVVKKSVTGSGSAKKDQIKKALDQILPGLGEIPEDASDALALALCHWLQGFCLDSKLLGYRI